MDLCLNLSRDISTCSKLPIATASVSRTAMPGQFLNGTPFREPYFRTGSIEIGVIGVLCSRWYRERYRERISTSTSAPFRGCPWTLCKTKVYQAVPTCSKRLVTDDHCESRKTINSLLRSKLFHLERPTSSISEYSDGNCRYGKKADDRALRHQPHSKGAPLHAFSDWSAE